MPISAKVKKYLENEKVSFQVTEHPLAYTAAEVAGSQHVPGRKMIKTVIVNSQNGFIMCILPATHKVDFEKLKKLSGVHELELATEAELKKLFPEYDLGAEPPFGHLYGLKVYADKVLDQESEIVFNAGTHTDAVKMKYQDFKRLVHPSIGDIGSHI